MVGQIADKSNRIGEQNSLSAGQLALARCGVQCRKKLITCKDSCVSQVVEQGGFSCIGIAHNGDACKPRAVSCLALGAAACGHFFNRALQHSNAALQMATVGLKLRFTGASGADAATKTGKLGASAHQARRGIFELCQLHLQLTLAADSVQCENVEDQHRAVDHADIAQHLFKVADLRRGQFAVKNR